MANKTVQDLVEIAKKGTEADIRRYIQDHWIDFPQDIQDHLAAALMSDALEEHLLAYEK